MQSLFKNEIQMHICYYALLSDESILIKKEIEVRINNVLTQTAPSFYAVEHQYLFMLTYFRGLQN